MGKLDVIGKISSWADRVTDFFSDKYHGSIGDNATNFGYEDNASWGGKRKL